MERLTIRNSDGTVSQPTSATIEDVFYRLAAYEDTGLMPEDIKAVREREDGLAQLLAQVSCNCAVTYTRLRELAQADKEGRLVVLPCKVGDTVYFVFEGKVHDVRVQGIPLGRNNELILNFGGYPVQYAWGSEIGKTVFLTREEAQKALNPCDHCFSGAYRGCGDCTYGETELEGGRNGN